MTDLNIDDCINETCPWSGKPVTVRANLNFYSRDLL